MKDIKKIARHCILFFNKLLFLIRLAFSISCILICIVLLWNMTQQNVVEDLMSAVVIAQVSILIVLSIVSFFASKAFFSSEQIYFLKSFGIRKRFIVTYAAFRNVAAPVTFFILSMIAHYFTKAPIIRKIGWFSTPVLLLLPAISAWLFSHREQGNVSRKSMTIPNNKYLLTWHKDMKLLWKETDFIAVVAMLVIFVAVYFSQLAPRGLWIGLYIAVWISSLSTQSVYSTELKYYILTKPFTDKRERLYMKYTGALLASFAVSLTFLIIASIGGHLSLLGFFELLAMQTICTVCLLLPPNIIVNDAVPEINRSNAKLYIFYITTLVPPVIFVWAIVYAVRGYMTRAGAKKCNETI